MNSTVLNIRSEKCLEQILNDNLKHANTIYTIKLSGHRVLLPKDLCYYINLKHLSINGCYRNINFSIISFTLKSLAFKTTTFKPNKTMEHFKNLQFLQYQIDSKNIDILKTFLNPPIPNHPLLTSICFSFGPGPGRFFSLPIQNSLFNSIRSRIKCIDFRSKPFELVLYLNPAPLNQDMISEFSPEIRYQVCLFVWFLYQSSANLKHNILYYLPKRFALARILPYVLCN